MISVGWKWEGVSFISNVQYSEEGLRVWRAYNIDPGKFIPWRKFDIPDKQEVPSLVSSSIDRNSEVNFAPIKVPWKRNFHNFVV